MRWLDDITDSMNMGLVRLWDNVGDGQGGLVCCSSWGQHAVQSLTTEQLN